MRRVRTHLSYANVMATAAVFIALGGTSYAVTQLPKNSVGSKQIRSGAVGASEIRTGAVRSKDIRDRSVALKDISKAARGSLRGQTGATGPQGPPGVGVTTLAAAVTAEGRYIRSKGTTADGTSHTSSGVYKLDFNRDLSSCYVAATIASTRGNTASGEIAAEIGTGANAQSVFVRTGESNGAAADLPFHLLLSC
jgi:hypothetical protein